MTAAEQPDVKEKIMEAAKKLFAELGYEGTSVRKICDQAGVSLPLVSYHFGGKENVYWAILEPLKSVPFQPMTDDPKEDLLHFVETMITFLQGEPEIAHILRQELSMNSPRSEALFPLVQNITDLLRSILERGQAQGVFRVHSVAHTMKLIIGSMTAFRNVRCFEALYGSDSDAPLQPKELFQFIYGGIGSS
ncbi:TetR/AcrR family transcriptional regulator [Paenibacillus caseinilyticus]|uniref:TetR family transcriptional regulator n=1 Tax=Paenibacillus mucilaginosus K02 TaxID=997761 RepID=I0BGW0_9BACL|nr:TetR family transcriptional regulator [Paenibacillus mucilaginosus]AFH61607.1 TetR family transcriptional regulator [Paenibacillus mucilaginosus K02]